MLDHRLLAALVAGLFFCNGAAPAAPLSARATAGVDLQARLKEVERDPKLSESLVKMGAKDRMHGSVTAANIAVELKSVTGQEVDKRKIELAEPIKSLGNYDISIKLYKGVEPKIKLNIVEKEKEPEKEAAGEPEKKSE